MYMPPETTEFAGEYSPARHDVFSFGVIWYQLLTCRLQRPAYDFADQLHEAGVDSYTIRLLARCLAQPSRRFADGRELLGALELERASPVWNVPAGCFDVGPLASEYLNSLSP
jgi:hypothetical protein